MKEGKLNNKIWLYSILIVILVILITLIILIKFINYNDNVKFDNVMKIDTRLYNNWFKRRYELYNEENIIISDFDYYNKYLKISKDSVSVCFKSVDKKDNCNTCQTKIDDKKLTLSGCLSNESDEYYYEITNDNILILRRIIDSKHYDLEYYNLESE